MYGPAEAKFVKLNKICPVLPRNKIVGSASVSESFLPISPTGSGSRLKSHSILLLGPHFSKMTKLRNFLD